jgi:hypothetical protein
VEEDVKRRKKQETRRGEEKLAWRVALGRCDSGSGLDAIKAAADSCPHVPLLLIIFTV